nr:Rieske 2Fe-2S domain-containing protein [bacterium]
HLGCQVYWEEDNNRFFCPCHSGVFDPQGIAIAGPPADAGQRLAEVPLKVDQVAGVLYLEVQATKGGHA